MNRKLTGLALTALLCIICCCQVLAEGEDVSSLDLSAQPVQFIENAGQAHTDILYQVKSPKFSFDFTRDSLLVSGPSEDCKECNNTTVSPVIVTLAGADNNTTVEPFDKLPGEANFLFGNNQSDWHTYVPWYGGIRYVNILPGVDLSYTGKDGVLKREYVVHEGADPGSIRMAYGGSQGVAIAADGSLIVNTSFGNLTELAPYSYQEINGTKVPITSSYQILENGEVGYSIGTYDTAYPLIIDPYLEYSTLLGGTLEDYGMDIATDKDGDVYVTGYTSSCNFPLVNPLLPSNNVAEYNGTYCHNSRDIFVTKIGINPSTGNATILFSTYLGGTKSDFGRAIAVDELKNIYIAGDTFSEDFPIVYPFAYGEELHGSNDAFVVKLLPDGAGIYWSDCIGGNFADQANDIALDSLNAVYMTGQTVGNNPYKDPNEIFPVTDYAYQTKPNTNGVMGDAFALKINQNGKTLDYSTYISGASQDYGNGIAVDGKGMAYIVGTTTSSNLLPSGIPGNDTTLSGGQDAFLFKMNFQAGLQPIYATYLGGSTPYDYGEAVAVDSADCAYVTGATASKDFPVTNGAMQTVKGWKYDAFDKDAFVTKYDDDGTGLTYSSYLGGSKDDWGYDIAVDDTGRAFVTGYSKSSQIPLSGLVNSIKSASGGQDGFLTVVRKDGKAAEFSTLFGGYHDDVSRGVAISSDGNTSYVTGYTSSPTILNCGNLCFSEAFPVLKWINQTTYWGNTYIGGNFTGDFLGSFDAFVMKFGTSTLVPSFTATPVCGMANPNLTVTFTDTTTGLGNIVSRVWNFGDGKINVTTPSVLSVSHNYTTPGTYLATLTLRTYTDTLVSQPRTITVCNNDTYAAYTVSGYNNTADPIPVPINTAINFYGSSNFSATSYVWNFNDGSANQTQNPTSHTFTSQGNFTVNMTARSGTCCGDKVASRNISVLAKPLALFEASTTSGCVPLVVSFTDRSPVDPIHGAPSAWSWNFGDNSDPVTTQNTTHTYPFAGTYSATLTVSNVAGTSTATPVKIVVSANATAAFTGSPRAGTAPLPVQFTDQSTGSVANWTWAFGDGATLSGSDPSVYQNPSHTYTSPGTYTVNLTVQSNCGGPADNKSYINYITVNANTTPRILFGNNTVPTLENPVNGTAVLNVKFQAKTTDGTLIDKAVWTFGDGNTTNQTRVTGWPSDNSWFNTSNPYYTIGNYTPVLQITNNTYGTGTSGGLYTDWIGVYPPMVVNFTMLPASGVVGESIQFTDTSSGNPVDWKWTFPEGTVSGVSSVSHAFNSSAVHAVMLEVWNKYGATAIGTKYITITSPDKSGVVYFVPQNITMETDESNYRVVNVVLSKADYGLSLYTVKIDLNNTARAHIRDWVSQPGWVDHFAYSWSPLFNTITLSGYLDSGSLPAGSRNISLGNISLAGISMGDALLTMNSTSSAQYDSSSMSLSGQAADIHVYSLAPLPGYENSPADLWPTGVHDGLLDDFDGNGVVNTADVSAFHTAWTYGSLEGLPVPPFDYNSNNRIDLDDIRVYFNRVW